MRVTNYAEDIAARSSTILHSKKTFILEIPKLQIQLNVFVKLKNPKDGERKKKLFSLIYSPLEELRTQKGEFPRTPTSVIIIFQSAFPTHVK